MEPLSFVRRAVAPYVAESGKSADDPEVLDVINEARRILYPLGDWRDTLESLVLNVQLGTVTLPPWAEAIRHSWQGAQRMDVENQWYQPLENQTFNKLCGNPLGNTLIDLGARFAVFKPYDKTFRIKVTCLDRRDQGTRLVFHAVSEYGEPVLLTRTLHVPFEPITADPQNDKWVKSITACTKPKTLDRVLVYIYDPVRGVNDLCAIYEATDINPQLRRYTVPRGCRSQIFAKVKKKYVPLTNNDELVDIHTDALIHAIQGITARRNRSPQEYAAQVQAAQNFLDREIKSVQPTQTNRVQMSRAFRVDNLGFESDY